MKRSPDLVEYIWPCGYHENVKIKPAPAIPFVPVDFPLPLTKPVEQFTESEKSGIPALRRCCKCGEKYPIFQIPDGCKLCNHSFQDPCSTCTIIGFCGLHEIATVELKVTGEFDQTPEYWRCRRCEDINPFQSGEETGSSNAFLTPKGNRCKRCSEPFHESNWVVSPFHVYLGSWDGKTVAESGPWHWSLAWHQDMPGERAIQHGKEGCYVRRDNGRPRRAIPWVGKSSQRSKEHLGAGNSVQVRNDNIQKMLPALPLPTPPQSRSASPSPFRNSRATGASLAKKKIRRPTADLYPPPLFSGHHTQEASNPPRRNMSSFKSPPPSGTEFNARPLPPLPPIPNDVNARERGRSQTRRGPTQDLIKDHGPSRLRLQTQTSHKERGRSHELPTKTGSSDNLKYIRPSQSQIFPPITTTHPSSTPTPDPPPIPKIAIQPDSPAVERARLASAARSSPSYPNSHIAAALNNTTTPPPANNKTHTQHKRARSLSIVAPTRNPRPQTPSRTPSRSQTPSRTPPRYSLFPSAASSRPGTPDYHRRPSVPVNHDRPQTASGYSRGHSRSRSEGHPPGTYISRDINGEMIFMFPAQAAGDIPKQLGDKPKQLSENTSTKGEYEREGGDGRDGGRETDDGGLSVQEEVEVPVSGWYDDEDDEEDEDGEGSGGSNRSRSHSRRRTLAKALKVRNWF